MEKMNNYRWIDQLPSGWNKIARKMIEECEAAEPNFEIIDLKEKWGMICMCAYPYTDKISEIEHYYERLSAQTCCKCGASATKISTGWILPWCNDCGIKEYGPYKEFNHDSTTTNNN